MSTKDIRHIIALYAEAWREREPGRVGQPPICDMALAEVKAIEKAARFIMYVDTSGALTPELTRNAAETRDTLERIAEESGK